MYKILFFLIIMLEFAYCDDKMESYEDYSDPIIEFLMNDNITEILGQMESDEVNDGYEPVFSDGIWKCGNCEKIDETKLIYNEVNEVDSNLENGDYLEVQVGIALDNMNCVTVSAGTESEIKRVAGSCTGPSLTLSVGYGQSFIVRVYGE